MTDGQLELSRTAPLDKSIRPVPPTVISQPPVGWTWTTPAAAARTRKAAPARLLMLTDWAELGATFDADFTRKNGLVMVFSVAYVNSRCWNSIAPIAELNLGGQHNSNHHPPLKNSIPNPNSPSLNISRTAPHSEQPAALQNISAALIGHSPHARIHRRSAHSLFAGAFKRDGRGGARNGRPKPSAGGPQQNH